MVKKAHTNCSALTKGYRESMENIKPNKLMWSKDMNTDFKMMKNILSKDPVMAYPKMDPEFQIHVDTSAKGLGTVLTQLINSQYRVIEYA